MHLYIDYHILCKEALLLKLCVTAPFVSAVLTFKARELFIKRQNLIFDFLVWRLILGKVIQVVINS